MNCEYSKAINNYETPHLEITQGVHVHNHVVAYFSWASTDLYEFMKFCLDLFGAHLNLFEFPGFKQKKRN